MPALLCRGLGKLFTVVLGNSLDIQKTKALKLLGCGCEADTSLPFALYAFLRHPDSFEECLMTAVLNGGDADTLGAMAGSLCGARVGINQIPHAWIGKLENQAYLHHLACTLYQAQTDSPRIKQGESETYYIPKEDHYGCD